VKDFCTKNIKIYNNNNLVNISNKNMWEKSPSNIKIYFSTISLTIQQSLKALKLSKLFSEMLIWINVIKCTISIILSNNIPTIIRSSFQTYFTITPPSNVTPMLASPTQPPTTRRPSWTTTITISTLEPSMN
jgi:hypothetical protein